MSKRGTVILVLVLAAAGGGYGLYRYLHGRTIASTSVRAEDVTRIERGSLTMDVRATGRVSPENQVLLAFKVAGRAAEVMVKEGQVVSAKQVLARLETGSLEQAVLQAEAALKATQAQAAKARAGSRTQEIAASEAARASAEAGVKAAEKGVEIARGNVVAAEATLGSARASLSKVLAGPSALDVQIAEKQVEASRNSLWGLQGQRDAVGGPGGNAGQRESARAQVAAAETQVQIAELQLQQLKAGARAEDIAIARAQIAQAEAGVIVAKAQLGQAEVQVESATAQARQAGAQFELLKAGLRVEDLAVADAQVAQAEAALNQARLALQDATLTAPIPGVVAEVNVKVNELVSPSQPAMILVDETTYHISVSVDETDIGQIVEQQQVQVTLDAYPNHQVLGRVAHIAPGASVEGGIVSYRVRVDIVSPEVPLREGLTANATIVTRRLDDVVLVPNEAVLVDDTTGMRFVAKVSGQEITVVPIETGYQTTMVSQVQSGLEAGDVVLLRSSSYRARFRDIMASFGRSTFTGR